MAKRCKLFISFQGYRLDLCHIFICQGIDTSWQVLSFVVILRNDEAMKYVKKIHDLLIYIRVSKYFGRVVLLHINDFKLFLDDIFATPQMT